MCCDGGVLSDAHTAVAVGADFMMLGRNFARIEESPSRLMKVNGQLPKEDWGDGFDRTRNWTRCDQGEDRIIFEEGVDGYVAFAGNLYNNVACTMTKLKNG